MATTTADVLIERLIDRGARVVFGLPGDGSNGITEALRVRQARSLSRRPDRSRSDADVPRIET